jgi:hypothetical protein
MSDKDDSTRFVVLEIKVHESGFCSSYCPLQYVKESGLAEDDETCPFDFDRDACGAAEIAVDEKTKKMAEERLKEINFAIYDTGQQTDELFRDQEVYTAYLALTERLK